MEEVELKFILGDNPCSIANVNELLRLIRFNMKKMTKLAKRESMPLGDCFAMCMSHELIHQIIFDIEGDCTSWQFENICYNKYKRMKHWIGGMGCE